MIAVINYGVGNSASVCNMLRKAGAKAKTTSDRNEILAADKIILPGVGHFDHAMQMLNESGLRGTLDRFAIELRRPTLGICLGAQILGKGSEEGKLSGLGWLDLSCMKLPATSGVRIPHMGWSEISVRRTSPLFRHAATDARYYFVHSYYMRCNNTEDTIAVARHGIEFTCAVQSRNIYGTQFHPEKSLRHGLAVLKAFAELNSNE